MPVDLGVKHQDPVDPFALCERPNLDFGHRLHLYVFRRGSGATIDNSGSNFVTFILFFPLIYHAVRFTRLIAFLPSCRYLVQLFLLGKL